jgi:uncharacterized membrane protein (UPF0182 family)
VQSDVFAKYHVTDATRFYRQNDRWLRSPDPNEVTPTDAATPGGSTRGAGRAPEVTSNTRRQAPYYLYIRLPDDDREHFVLLQPFVPVSGGDQQIRLSSFLTAKSDGDDYGKLETFVMPSGREVRGPVQVANAIQGDDELARVFTQLDQRGSQVIFGNLQLIPVGESLVYIQPIFVQRSQQGYPQFQFVVVFTQGKAPVQAQTVEEGLNILFGLQPREPDEGETPTEGTQTVDELLAEAADRFAEADQALAEGDLARYEELIDEARDLVDQARQLAQGDATEAPTTTTTTTSPPSAQSAGAR